MKVILFCFVVSAFIAAVLGGEYVVTHAPQYVKFRPTTSAIDTNEIDALVTSTFGLTSSKALHWDGLLAGSVFHRPKAVALISIYGATGVTLPSDLPTYTTSNDEFVNTESVMERIEHVFPTGKSVLVDFSTDDTVFDVEARNPGTFTSLPSTMNDVSATLTNGIARLGGVASLLSTLKVTEEPDVFFLGEMLAVREIINQVKQHSHLAADKYPDFFHFRFLSLSRVSDKYGISSKQFVEATTILSAFIKELTGDLREVYRGNVVVSVVTINSVPTRAPRKTRSLLMTNQNDPAADIGLVGTVDETYAVIFNIVLWGMIALALTVYAIAYGIWNMDPGRDSIIYRMTSQRMKRD